MKTEKDKFVTDAPLLVFFLVFFAGLLVRQCENDRCNFQSMTITSKPWKWHIRTRGPTLMSFSKIWGKTFRLYLDLFLVWTRISYQLFVQNRLVISLIVITLCVAVDVCDYLKWWLIQSIESDDFLYGFIHFTMLRTFNEFNHMKYSYDRYIMCLSIQFIGLLRTHS